MATTAAEERKVIAQLFNDEEMQVALDKILSGKRLEDKAYEQVVARAFVERAKIGFGGATLFTLSDSDMHSRAAALMGVNDMGKSIIDDDDFIKNAVKNVFVKNPNEFDRLKNGESKLVGFFMGQVMKEVKGKANPKSIQELINKYIGD